jgi:Caspase domain
MTLHLRSALWAVLTCSFCTAQNCPQDQPQGVNRPVPAPQNPRVCRYDRPSAEGRPPYWWQLLYELFKWKPKGQPPFRRSVAFLAGVSHYNHISQQLDFVKTDLTDFRNFLLTDGGFDTVYEVREGNVSRGLIDDFMSKYFSDPEGPVGPEDRLLFYYSGHGGAQNGVVPYLLFQNANPPADYTDALRVRDVYDWAKSIPAKHLLVILDSCFSGLAADKAGPEDINAGIANALAGERSGLMLTAGTGDEKAYAVQYSTQKNGSIFTHALIDAMRSMSKTEGIVTIGEAFERATVTVKVFDAVENKKMTPLPTPLPRREGLGEGKFIFINPKAENPTLPLGLYGGSPIVKAPDSVDPNLTLIQKEYDEAIKSQDLPALRAFVSSYKGKSFGQTLVSLVEEKIRSIRALSAGPGVRLTDDTATTGASSR